MQFEMIPRNVIALLQGYVPGYGRLDRLGRGTRPAPPALGLQGR